MLTAGANCKPRLEFETFCRLRELIYSRCGITFSDAKMYLLEARVIKRLDERGLKTFEDYCYFITYDRDREAEIKCLLNSIVTNETSFFRDTPQLESFIKGVVPAVMEDKKKDCFDRTLRVWSAACSTGEEPATIAMLLLEEGLHLKGWNIEIIGSDISDNALKCAAAARYDRYALRNTPEYYLRKYFAPSGDAYVLKKHAAEIVKYRRINLIDQAEARSVRGADIIFCRNLFIYFDDASKKKAVAHLYDSLVKGGYLIVGFSESLHSVTRLFKPVNIARSLVYRKA